MSKPLSVFEMEQSKVNDLSVAELIDVLKARMDYGLPVLQAMDVVNAQSIATMCMLSFLGKD